MKTAITYAEQVSQDIFKAGTLVVSKLDNLVIFLTEDTTYDIDRFCGATLTLSHQHTIAGEYQNDWVKDCFVKFIGSVLLEQEA